MMRREERWRRERVGKIQHKRSVSSEHVTLMIRLKRSAAVYYRNRYIQRAIIAKFLHSLTKSKPIK